MNGPPLEVRPARPDQKEVLRNLLQLYMHDFSEFAAGVAAADGRFRYHDDLDQRWGRSRYNAFFLVAYDRDPRDGIPDWRADGFAVVTNESYFDEPVAPNQWLMDDFFVMRKYRRGYAGTMFARWCFDAFYGLWEVGEMRENTAAQAFWRKVISEYTQGSYAEHASAPRWAGPVQRFRNDAKDLPRLGAASQLGD
jgi:predicted acetyltransferase